MSFLISVGHTVLSISSTSTLPQLFQKKNLKLLVTKHWLYTKIVINALQNKPWVYYTVQIFAN